MTAYYNEFKPEAAHMLRQLIKDGLIAAGDVDERSITEVKADDNKNYTQCHFFAGIGGWSVALRLAGWGDDKPVWTGSCPCQPFSSAGKRKGHADERNLWPVWFRLIAECGPSIVFGEQVASAITYGWWDGVASDMESKGYTCAAAVLPACAVGKAHRRERLWYVGNSESAGTASLGGICQGETNDTFGDCEGSPKRIMGDTGLQRPEGGEQRAGGAVQPSESVNWVVCPDGKTRPLKPGLPLLADGILGRTSILHALGNAIVPKVAAEFINAYQECRA